METWKTEWLVGVAMHVLFASSDSKRKSLNADENRTQNAKWNDHVDPRQEQAKHTAKGIAVGQPNHEIH